MKIPYLTVADVDYYYRHGTEVHRVFHKLSFQIQKPQSEGRIICIMGRSGCGKTTLLKLLSGELLPISGSVIFYPTTPSPIVFQTQEPVLFEHLTLYENVSFFNNINHTKKYFNKQLLDNIITTLGLTELLRIKSKNISTLSGGEKQRLVLARSVSIEPNVLLLDEPCTGIDPGRKKDFLMQLLELVRTLKLTVFYVTHHFDEVRLIADEVLYLENVSPGERTIVQFGSLDMLQDKPYSIELAEILTDGIINIMECSVEGNCLKIGTQNFQYSGDAIAVNGRYLLAINPQVIMNTSGEKLRLKGVSRSGAYKFIEVEGLTNRLIVDKTFDDSTEYVMLSGQGMLAKNESGLIIGRINIST